MRDLGDSRGEALFGVALALMIGLVNISAAQNPVVVWGSLKQADVPLAATNLASVAAGPSGCVGIGRDGSLHPWGTIGGTLPVTATNAFAVALGSRPVVLRRDGSVVNHLGVVPGVSNAVAVASTSYGGGALRQDGVFTSWDYYSTLAGTSNLTAIAGGDDALYVDGTVFAYNIPQAQLLSNIVAMDKSGSQRIWLRSDGTVAAHPATNTPPGLSNVIAVAAGDNHVLALKNDGTVMAWSNLGVQTNVPSNLSNVVAIAAGTSHSLALKADGTVATWGGSGYAQFGKPTNLANVAAIFARADYSVALVGPSPPALLAQIPDLTVWAGRPATYTVRAVGSPPLRFQWQRNGEVIPDATNSFLRLEQVNVSDAGFYNVVISNARGTAISRESRLSVRASPSILAQPTNQTKVFGSSVSLSVSATGSPPPSYQWYWRGISMTGATQANLTLTDLAAGRAGDYWCVVSNAIAQVTSSVARLTVNLPVTAINKAGWIGGRSDFTPSYAGTKPISWQWFTTNGPMAGTTNAALTLTDLTPEQEGDYWVVGTASFGSCTSAPVRLTVNGFAVWGGQYYTTPTSTPRVAAIGAAGYSYFVERVDGTPPVWDFFDLNGNRNGMPAGVSNIVALAGLVALSADGRVTVWGYGPTNVPTGLSNVVAIAAGTVHYLALTADGSVRVWGSDNPSLAVPPGLQDVVTIASSRDHCLALTSGGTVVAWGWNDFGQINVPLGLRNVVAIAAGERHSVALRADGTVVVWGSNDLGQRNVPPGLSNVIAIAAGFFHTLALRSDGTVVAWGPNFQGENNIPAGLSGVVAIAAGDDFNLAIVQKGLASSPVQIASWTRSQGAYSVQVPTIRGKTYYLQYRDTLNDPWWTPLPPVPGDGTVKTLSDAQATTLQRFYRVWQKP